MGKSHLQYGRQVPVPSIGFEQTLVASAGCRGVASFGRTCCCILNELQRKNGTCRHTSQKRVAVVYMQADKSLTQNMHGLAVEWMFPPDVVQHENVGGIGRSKGSFGMGN